LFSPVGFFVWPFRHSCCNSSEVAALIAERARTDRQARNAEHALQS